MKDVLSHNSTGNKGHKTATAPWPDETFRGTCPTALNRRTASPRGILHLTLFGIPISLQQTTFVARLCEGAQRPRQTHDFEHNARKKENVLNKHSRTMMRPLRRSSSRNLALNMIWNTNITAQNKLSSTTSRGRRTKGTHDF